MRINKLLSNFGICSRKDANRWILDGRVNVNGELCTQGQWVELEDEVLIDGKPIEERNKVYIVLNKPIGIITTAAKDVQKNIVDFMNYQEYVFPVGRLDKDSQGLILMTNDGELANKILQADNHYEKEYIVTVDKPLTEEFINGMSRGVQILGGRTRPCKVIEVDEYVFKIILTQGLNRQIRRMTRAFGYTVTKLERIRILSICLNDMKEGQWRFLSEEEVINLKENN